MITKPTKCGFLSSAKASNGTICAAFATTRAVAMRDCAVVRLKQLGRSITCPAQRENTAVKITAKTQKLLRQDVGQT